MKNVNTTRRMRKSEQGYALVMMMFFLALLVLSTVVASPTVISSVQREKEKEMVWRGKQYTRGIRMYYVKMKRFPTSLDDLTTNKNGYRFMRQAYKDPMNPDGTWRLIYVGPNGALIGSLNPQNQMMGLNGTAMAGMQNTAFGATGSTFGNTMNSSSSGNSSFGNSSFGNSNFGDGNSSFGNSSFGNSSFGNSTNTQNGTQAPGTPTDPNAQNGDDSDQMGQPHSLQMMDASNTIGGNIIGVGSKINKKSFLWYEKAKNYRQFEFIWNPMKDMGSVGGASRGIGTPVQNINGTSGNTNSSPNGTGFGTNGGQNNQMQSPGGTGDPNAIPPLQAPNP